MLEAAKMLVRSAPQRSMYFCSKSGSWKSRRNHKYSESPNWDAYQYWGSQPCFPLALPKLRFQFDFSAAVLLQIVAETNPVHVLRQLHDPVVIDERSRVDVSGVAPDRVPEIGAIKDVFKLVQVSDEP